MIEIIKANKILFLYSLIILLANIYFLTLPLVNVLGFEFSLANAVILCILSGLLRLSYKRKIFNNHFINISFFKQTLLLLAIPFTVSFFHSLFTGFCSLPDGIIFYLIITVVSALVGISVAETVFAFVRNFLSNLLFIIVILSILSVAVAEIYFNPQVYLYNPVFAYFPGTIYDEGLRPEWKLVIYRLINLLYFGSIFLMFKSAFKLKIKNKIARLMTAVIAAHIFYFTSPYPGYSTTHSYLNSQLPVKFESAHILLNTKINNPEDSLIILSAEYYYYDLRKYFIVNTDRKIKIYLFETADEKKKLFGSENADVAKPWLNEIYISRQNWNQTLKHEMAHCFAASFGSTLFKIAADFNPALIEGTAESADGFYDEIPIHYLAKTAFKNSYKINTGELFKPGFNFFNQNSGLSYIYAGSFCKYLIDMEGITKFKKFYNEGYSENIYNKSLTELIKEYELFLDTLDYSANFNTAQYYFGTAGIFSKYCPRYYEEKISDAWDNLNAGRFEYAVNNFGELLNTSKNYYALEGLILSFEKSGKIDKALKELQSKKDDYRNSTYYYLLTLREGDLLSKNYDYEKASEVYRKLVIEKPSVRLEMISMIRLELLEKSKSMLNKYLTGSDFDKYHLLKSLYKTSYEYFLIPVMIELSERLDEDYDLFLENIQNKIEVKDYLSCYAMIKLSEYMFSNMDFINARKITSLSIRYNSDADLKLLAEDNFRKIEWSYKNSDMIFRNLKITYDK